MSGDMDLLGIQPIGTSGPGSEMTFVSVVSIACVEKFGVFKTATLNSTTKWPKA
jgi:hypothetical protein